MLRGSSWTLESEGKKKQDYHKYFYTTKTLGLVYASPELCLWRVVNTLFLLDHILEAIHLYTHPVTPNYYYFLNEKFNLCVLLPNNTYTRWPVYGHWTYQLGPVTCGLIGECFTLNTLDFFFVWNSGIFIPYVFFWCNKDRQVWDCESVHVCSPYSRVCGSWSIIFFFSQSRPVL